MDATANFCFGYVVKKDAQLPWDYEHFDHYVHDWWYRVNNFAADPTHMRYTEERHKFLKHTPLPVNLIPWGYEDNLGWIIASKGLSFSSDYTDELPCVIHPANFIITHENRLSLLSFITRFDIPVIEESLGWHLSSCLYEY